MDTWMEDEYPWLIDEKNRIKEYVINQETLFRFLFRLPTTGEVLW